jgi:hypothetical protein
MSRGVVPQDQMNTHAVGIEAANNGVGEPWTQQQIDAYFKLSLALTRNLGLGPADVCSHQRYAPDRKVDPATAAAVQGPWRPGSVNSSGSWNNDHIQAECIERSAPLPPPEEDVQVVEIQVDGANASFIGYRVQQGGLALIPWVEWVNGADPAQLARLQSYRNVPIPTHRMTSIDDFKGVTLIGPVPTGDALYSWSRSNFGNVV